jgi:hypothetical protein
MRRSSLIDWPVYPRLGRSMRDESRPIQVEPLGGWALLNFSTVDGVAIDSKCGQ